MGPVDFTLTVIALFLCLALLVYFTRILCSHLFILPGHFLDSFRLRRSISCIRKADALLEENRAQEALRELEGAFLLEACGSKEVVEFAREQHQAILSRCLVAADALGGTFEDLPDIERTLNERSELFLSRLRLQEAFRKISQRRGEAGKELPSWGKAEHRRRVLELEQLISENKARLHLLIPHFLEKLQSPGKESITYH